MKKQILLCLMLILISFANPKQVFAENYQFEVLSTTDMHGRATNKNIATGNIEPHSMEKVASIVKNERKKFDNKIILIDNGDLLQGTLVSQYALNYKTSQENPMITALKYMKYDAWVMGNHEFNYSPIQRNTQVKYAQNADIAVLAANIVLKNDGTNIFSKKQPKGSPFYTPYITKTIQFDKNKKVKIAILGLGNANNANWDRSENYPNLQFNSLNNPKGLLENEINFWVDKIKKETNPDIIIVSAHSGKSNDTNTQIKGFSLESQIVSGAQNSKNVDLFIYGHDHQLNIEKVKTLTGKEIYIVNAGGISVVKNVFTVNFDKNNKFKNYSVTADFVALEKENSDKKLTKKENKWYKLTEKWVSSSIAKFNGGWNNIQNQSQNKTNEDMIFNQSELCNLIHKAQIWTSWQNKNIKGAEVSITSPVFATDNNGQILFTPEDNDTLNILKLALLYRFDNNLPCMVDMTPKQLYNWLNCVANKLTLDKNGNPTIKSDASLHGIDTFYGIDYTIDLTKPDGQKITKAEINGQNLLQRKEKIRVVLNSFRLAGSHGFRETTGLQEKDAIWTSLDTLEPDKASIQYQIGEYAKAVKVLKPYQSLDYVKNSTWNIITK